MLNYTTNRDFPPWALEIIPDLVQSYIDRRLDSASGAAAIPLCYKGLWEYPFTDSACSEFAEVKAAQRRQWDLISLELLTNDQCKRIWELVLQARILPSDFLLDLHRSFTEFPEHKTDLMTRSVRERYLEETRDLATKLASRLSGTRYEDATTNQNNQRIYSAIENSLKEAGIESSIIETWFSWIGILVKPLPFELKELSEIINDDLSEGNCHVSLNTVTDLDGSEYSTPPPLVVRKHLDREGQRAHFYKGLARRLNESTGNPRPTLVAQTTSFIFSDLGDLTPNYISRNWLK